MQETTLEMFFFLGSTYTYLSVNRAAQLAEAKGVKLLWRPFSVRTLMREQNNSPFAGKPIKMQYMWRDIARRADRFGIAFNGAAPYPIDAHEVANHVATLAAVEGWCDAFATAAYRVWFIEKRDPGEIENLRTVLASIGQDADRCIAAASTPAILQTYSQTTDRARALGIFGSPTFVVGEEIFWGDDRLEDAVEWCKSRRLPA
jgi:2-hydroxychromene-2-carboxylate isomerase